jgi:hypothetical protein
MTEWTIPPDVVSIINSLIEKSKAGEVQWVEGTDLGFAEGYGVNFGSYTIRLFEKNGYNEWENSITLEILNDDGKSAIRARALDVEAQHQEHELLGELLEAARRRAMKADVIIKDLSEKLKATGMIGVPPRNKRNQAAPPPSGEPPRAAPPPSTPPSTGIPDPSTGKPHDDDIPF